MIQPNSRYLFIPKFSTVELVLKEDPPGMQHSILPRFDDEDLECFEEIRDLEFVDMIDESLGIGTSITISASHPKGLTPDNIVAKQKIIIAIINRHRERVQTLERLEKEHAERARHQPYNVD